EAAHLGREAQEGTAHADGPALPPHHPEAHGQLAQAISPPAFRPGEVRAPARQHDPPRGDQRQRRWHAAGPEAQDGEGPRDPRRPTAVASSAPHTASISPPAAISAGAGGTRPAPRRRTVKVHGTPADHRTAPSMNAAARRAGSGAGEPGSVPAITRQPWSSAS